MIIPDFGTVAGPFQITSLEFAGEHNGELTTSLRWIRGGAFMALDRVPGRRAR